MCGSDWMDYEYYYDHKEWIGKDLEIGLNAVFSFFQFFNTDFWIVNGLCKLFFFFVVVNFYSLLTNKPFAAIGFGVVTMCFMLISCPMRFMMAMAFLFIATKYFMKHKWILGFVFVVISILFHVSMLAIALIAASAFLLSKPFASIKTHWLVLSYFGLYALMLMTNFNEIIFKKFLVFLLDSEDMAAYALSYGENFSTSVFLSVGRIREIASFLVIVCLRSTLLNKRYGYLVFFYAMLGLFISPIVSGMSTAFRLNLFFYSFVDVALVIVLYESLLNSRQLIKLLKYSFIAIIFVSMLRTITADYTFIPYTNSIPYIITEHKPLPERLNYNKNAYKDRTGHSYDSSN